MHATRCGSVPRHKYCTRPFKHLKTQMCIYTPSRNTTRRKCFIYANMHSTLCECNTIISVCNVCVNEWVRSGPPSCYIRLTFLRILQFSLVNTLFFAEKALGAHESVRYKNVSASNLVGVSRLFRVQNFVWFE